MQTNETLWMDATRLAHLNFYLSWIGIVLVIIGAIVSAGSVLITKQIDKLTKIESDARQKKIETLEFATRPKPFRERLIAQLDAVDPQIITLHRSGQTNFALDFTTHHFTDLQRLAAELGAVEYIEFREIDRRMLTKLPYTNSAEFTLSPSLLKP